MKLIITLIFVGWMSVLGYSLVMAYGEIIPLTNSYYYIGRNFMIGLFAVAALVLPIIWIYVERNHSMRRIGK